MYQVIGVGNNILGNNILKEGAIPLESILIMSKARGINLAA